MIGISNILFTWDFERFSFLDLSISTCHGRQGKNLLGRRQPPTRWCLVAIHHCLFKALPLANSFATIGIVPRMLTIVLKNFTRDSEIEATLTKPSGITGRWASSSKREDLIRTQTVAPSPVCIIITDPNGMKFSPF